MKKIKKNSANSPIPSVGIVHEVSLKKEIQGSYLDYAMSVIVSRALPDVRDGLKPVQRRILYAMYQDNLLHNTKFRKSATVVGAVLGRFHPHGDLAVYEAMVRMAQNFSLRYPLIDGNGNFGSIDGDPAAAHRYTEARLTASAEEILNDLGKETVKFIPNYDGTLEEPTVLPAALPNLVLNGAMGIAVGMATNIPPHNLKEVCDALIYLLDNPEAEVDDICQFIKGPDFPTGGIIFNPQQIKEVYASGRGAITVRAQTDIEEDGKNNFIIVREIPYQVNKSDLLSKIADLVKDKRIEGIRDIRDESASDGIRIVIEIKKDFAAQKVLNQLFKLTELQLNFNVNLIALEEGIQPRLFGFKDLLSHFLKHRQIVLKLRIEFDLRKVQDRLHILEGLTLALEQIDKIITIIKKSDNRKDAKINLMQKVKLSDRQADAILEMKLHQLAGLERLEVEKEYKDKKETEKMLKNLLTNKKIFLDKLKEEIKFLREKYGDERRTEVKNQAASILTEEDMVSDRPALIAITEDDYIKRLEPENFKVQMRGGKGVSGFEIKEEDKIKKLLFTNLHSDLYFFSDRGKVFSLKAYEIPETSRAAKGKPLVNFLSLSAEETISEIFSSQLIKVGTNLVLMTEKGTIKKIKADFFQNIRRSGLNVITLKDDLLKKVVAVNDNDQLIAATRNGQAIRFEAKKIRIMGRQAAGVRGIHLKKDDRLIGLSVVRKDEINDLFYFVVSENGFGKITPIKDYRLQNRGGSGIKTAKVTSKTGCLVTALVFHKNEIAEKDILVTSHQGNFLRLPLKQVSQAGRQTQGVKIMRFKTEQDKVASIAAL